MSAEKSSSAVAPALRFAGFDEPWRTRRFGDIATVKHGFAFKGEYFASEGEYILLTPGNFDPHGGFRYQGEKEKFYASNDFPKEYILNRGDLLTVMTEQAVGLIGCAVIVPEDAKFLHNQRLGLFQFVDETDKRFIYHYLRTNAMQVAMSNTAAGSKVRHTSPKRIEKLAVRTPTLPEQRKLADFLTAVDGRIQQLSQKKTLLEDHKKGVMQQLFTQVLRFKDDHGNEFPDWEEKKLGEVLHEHKEKSNGTESVYSVSVHKGLINQIEHLGRSFAAASTSHYNRVNPNDVVYTKSPTGDFPLGIIKQSHASESVIVSPLYAVFKPKTPGLGRLLEVYFESPCNVHNYLHSLIQKGAKNTFSINNSTFLSKALPLPVSLKEQQKVGAFFTALDRKIESVAKQITHTQAFKKGLLQQMFV